MVTRTPRSTQFILNARFAPHAHGEVAAEAGKEKRAWGYARSAAIALIELVLLGVDKWVPRRAAPALSHQRPLEAVVAGGVVVDVALELDRFWVVDRRVELGTSTDVAVRRVDAVALQTLGRELLLHLPLGTFGGSSARHSPRRELAIEKLGAELLECTGCWPLPLGPQATQSRRWGMLGPVALCESMGAFINKVVGKTEKLGCMQRLSQLGEVSPEKRLYLPVGRQGPPHDIDAVSEGC